MVRGRKRVEQLGVAAGFGQLARVNAGRDHERVEPIEQDARDPDTEADRDGPRRR